MEARETPFLPRWATLRLLLGHTGRHGWSGGSHMATFGLAASGLGITAPSQAVVRGGNDPSTTPWPHRCGEARPLGFDKPSQEQIAIYFS